MDELLDTTPVIFRAQDRLPINFQDGIFIKDVLIHGDNGGSIIGHTFGDRYGTVTNVADLLNLITTVCGIKPSGMDLPFYYTGGLSINSEASTTIYGDRVYLVKPEEVPFVTQSTFDPSKWDLMAQWSQLVKNEVNEQLVVTSNNQTVFTISNTPTNKENTTLTVNGIKYRYGATYDYSIANNILTWTNNSFTLDTSDRLMLNYLY